MRLFDRMVAAVMAVGLSFGMAGCDLVTSAPDFSTEASAEAPLVSEQSFVLVGPDSTDRIPLIDTTESGVDSLFSVGPGDESVTLSKEVAVVEDRSLARLFPRFTIGPGSASVSARQFMPDRLGAAFGDSVGIWTRPAVRTSLLPIQSNEDGFFAVAPDAATDTSDTGLMGFSTADVTALVLSEESVRFNEYHFTLLNQLSEPLVHPDSDERPPSLVVETPDGETIVRGQFSSTANSGERVSARLDVAGERLPRPVRFRLEATTPAGAEPIRDRPQAVMVATEALPFRVVQTDLRRAAPQPRSSLSIPPVSLDAGSGVTGVVIRDGTVRLTLRNSMPYPVVVHRIVLKNAEAVGDVAAGTEVLQVGPLRVPARSSRTTVVELGPTAISARLTADVEAEGEGVDVPVAVRAEDGLEIEADFRYTLDRLYLRPDGQRLELDGKIPIRSRSIRLEGEGNFVTLDRGTLFFESIRNELPASVDPLRLRFPSITTRPSASPEPLVVQFGESGREETDRIFPPLAGGQVIRNQRVDVAGMRVEFPGASMPLEGAARLAPDPAVQAFEASDRVSTTVELRDPGVQELRAEVDPRSALIPVDQDGDRALGILTDSEARVFDGSPFHQIGGVRITSLDLSDTQVRLAITTNIAARADLYLAVLGRRNDGREVFLSGSAPYDVAEEDTIAHALRRDGRPIPKTDLLRIPVSGAASPDEPVTEVITLDQETANVTKFLRLLPNQVRVIGRLIVAPDGGFVEMKKPVEFRLRFGLSQPIRVGGEIAFSHTTGADLGALESLVSSESTVSIDELGLRIPYENEFPLSTTLHLDALDDWGAVLNSIPESDADTLRLQPAPITQAGTSAGRETGAVGVRQSREQLLRLSEGDSLRMNVQLQSPANREVVVQADNGFSLRLEGAADLRINPSN